MATDLLNTYKMGWKTAYYQNTYDSKKDEDEIIEQPINLTPQTGIELIEEDCESCTI